MPKPKRIYLKPRRPWRLRRYPPRRDRPPWPMSRRERLYENRKRKRRTEIPSEYRQHVEWKVGDFISDFCDNCHRRGACCNACGCTPEYERMFDVFARRTDVRARFHRLTRQERLYERRKRASQRARAYSNARDSLVRRYKGPAHDPGEKQPHAVFWKLLLRVSAAVAHASPKWRRVHHY